MPNEPKVSFTDFKGAVNLGSAVCHIMATPMNTLLHFKPGERSAGLPGLMAVPLILFVCMLTSKYDVHPLLGFLGVYVVLAWGWKKYAVYRRKRKKELIHSRYTGTSYLYLPLRRRWQLTPENEIKLKKIEPFIVMGIGWAVLTVNLPLGMYLMASALAMGLSMGIQEMIETAKQLDDQDMMIEQQRRAQEMARARGQ